MQLPRTIAWRLVVLVTAAILPVLAFAAFMMARYAEAERAGHQLQTLATARALSVGIDRELATQQTLAVALSGSAALANRDWETFHRRAKTLLGDDPERRVLVIDVAGRQILNTFLPYGSDLPDTDPRPVREVVKTGAPIVSDLVFGGATRRPVIGLYVPIFEEGRVAQVLAVGLDADRISRILRDQRMPQGWLAAVVDRNGIILARNRLSEAFVGQSATPEYLQVIRAAEEGVAESVTKEGIPVHGAFARSAVSGWTTVVAVDTAVLNAALIRSLQWLGAGGVLLLAAGASAAVFYGRRIAEPIGTLAVMATSLGEGRPLAKREFAIGEVQRVAEEMQAAATLLRRRAEEREALLGSLEQRVQVRTRELAESEARYRMLAENANDMIVHADLNRVWRYVSPSCRRMLGFEAVEMIGKSAVGLIHPDDADRVAEAVRALRPGAERMTCAFRARRKDGAFVWHESSWTLLLDPEGKPASYMVVARDITKRKEAEAQAERAAAAAEAANRAKSQFLASMSHELRTPLNAVIGFGQLLLEGNREPLTARQREYLEYILRGGNQLLGLINDVLDLAKIEAGKLTVSIGRVEVAGLIESLAVMLGPMAHECGVRIETTPLPLCPAVRADRARLLQVLINLGTNAIKYNRRGGSVMIRARVAEDGWVRISVTDTGSGIAPGRRREVFEPFNRLGAEQSGTEGTGIGLAISKQLIEMMAGRIDFISEEGQGSTFWVELPEDGIAESGSEVSAGGSELSSSGDAFMAALDQLVAALGERVTRNVS
ncbi:sensor histidine kinase [Desertibaculum subflavum]|uniref:sensor histidine kinase n=1 Tax=Desertibaculum subflavum TaxID=2268458 RepID=UPI000E667C5F